ncbi:MAG: glycosyltransferase family 4 protein [bacterium]
MNIIQITDERWDSGITNYALALSVGLKKKGHKVVFVGLEDKPPVIQAKKMFLNVRYIKSTRDMLGFIRIIEEEKIDLINAHTGSSHTLSVVSALFAGRRLAIIRTRADRRAPKEGLLSKLVSYKTDRFITAGNFINDMYTELGVPEGKIETVYQGIDIEQFSATSTLHSSLFSEKDKKKRIGIVGRLDPVKGHYSFLRAMGLVKARIPDIEILVVGKEENVKEIELRHLARDIGIQENILFIGYTQNVPEIMANCAVGVISSVGSEATSRVLLEWMAAGKPIIATKVGVIPEVVKDGVTGFLVPPEDSEIMAEKVITLLEDDDVLKRMSKESRKLVEEKFSENVFVGHTEKIYAEILASRKIVKDINKLL